MLSIHPPKNAANAPNKTPPVTANETVENPIERLILDP